MSRRLSDEALAYNACVDVVNDRDERIEELMEERDRAWQAAEALAPIGTHGIKGARLVITPVRRKKR